MADEAVPKKKRRRACKALLPIFGGDFAAGCHFWTGHKGLHEGAYPDVFGRTVSVSWHDDYPALADEFLKPVAHDMETRVGLA